MANGTTLPNPFTVDQARNTTSGFLDVGGQIAAVINTMPLQDLRELQAVQERLRYAMGGSTEAMLGQTRAIDGLRNGSTLSRREATEFFATMKSGSGTAQMTSEQLVRLGRNLDSAFPGQVRQAMQAFQQFTRQFPEHAHQMKQGEVSLTMLSKAYRQYGEDGLKMMMANASTSRSFQSMEQDMLKVRKVVADTRVDFASGMGLDGLTAKFAGGATAAGGFFTQLGEGAKTSAEVTVRVLALMAAIKALSGVARGRGLFEGAGRAAGDDAGGGGGSVFAGGAGSSPKNPAYVVVLGGAGKGGTYLPVPAGGGSAPKNEPPPAPKPGRMAKIGAGARTVGRSIKGAPRNPYVIGAAIAVAIAAAFRSQGGAKREEIATDPERAAANAEIEAYRRIRAMNQGMPKPPGEDGVASQNRWERETFNQFAPQASAVRRMSAPDTMAGLTAHSDQYIAELRDGLALARQRNDGLQKEYADRRAIAERALQDMEAARGNPAALAAAEQKYETALGELAVTYDRIKANNIDRIKKQLEHEQQLDSRIDIERMGVRSTEIQRSYMETMMAPIGARIENMMANVVAQFAVVARMREKAAGLAKDDPIAAQKAMLDAAQAAVEALNSVNYLRRTYIEQMQSQALNLPTGDYAGTARPVGWKGGVGLPSEAAIFGSGYYNFAPLETDDDGNFVGREKLGTYEQVYGMMFGMAASQAKGPLEELVQANLLGNDKQDIANQALLSINAKMDGFVGEAVGGGASAGGGSVANRVGHQPTPSAAAAAGAGGPATPVGAALNQPYAPTDAKNPVGLGDMLRGVRDSALVGGALGAVTGVGVVPGFISGAVWGIGGQAVNSWNGATTRDDENRAAAEANLRQRAQQRAAITREDEEAIYQRYLLLRPGDPLGAWETIKATPPTFFRSGGEIPAPHPSARVNVPGSTDDQIALVDGHRPIIVGSGEFIVNRESTSRHRGLLEKINNGGTSSSSAFDDGGIVPAGGQMSPEKRGWRYVGVNSYGQTIWKTTAGDFVTEDGGVPGAPTREGWIPLPYRNIPGETTTMWKNSLGGDVMVTPEGWQYHNTGMEKWGPAARSRSRDIGGGATIEETEESGIFVRAPDGLLRRWEDPADSNGRRRSDPPRRIAPPRRYQPTQAEKAAPAEALQVYDSRYGFAVGHVSGVFEVSEGSVFPGTDIAGAPLPMYNRDDVTVKRAPAFQNGGIVPAYRFGGVIPRHDTAADYQRWAQEAYADTNVKFNFAGMDPELVRGALQALDVMEEIDPERLKSVGYYGSSAGIEEKDIYPTAQRNTLREMQSGARDSGLAQVATLTREDESRFRLEGVIFNEKHYGNAGELDDERRKAVASGWSAAAGERGLGTAFHEWGHVRQWRAKLKPAVDLATENPVSRYALTNWKEADAEMLSKVMNTPPAAWSSVERQYAESIGAKAEDIAKYQANMAQPPPRGESMYGTVTLTPPAPPAPAPTPAAPPAPAPTPPPTPPAPAPTPAPKPAPKPEQTPPAPPAPKPAPPAFDLPHLKLGQDLPGVGRLEFPLENFTDSRTPRATLPWPTPSSGGGGGSGKEKSRPQQRNAPVETDNGLVINPRKLRDKSPPFKWMQVLPEDQRQQLPPQTEPFPVEPGKPADAIGEPVKVPKQPDALPVEQPPQPGRARIPTPAPIPGWNDPRWSLPPLQAPPTSTPTPQRTVVEGPEQTPPSAPNKVVTIGPEAISDTESPLIGLGAGQGRDRGVGIGFGSGGGGGSGSGSGAGRGSGALGGGMYENFIDANRFRQRGAGPVRSLPTRANPEREQISLQEFRRRERERRKARGKMRTSEEPMDWSAWFQSGQDREDDVRRAYGLPTSPTTRTAYRPRIPRARRRAGQLPGMGELPKMGPLPTSTPARGGGGSITSRGSITSFGSITGGGGSLLNQEPAQPWDRRGRIEGGSRGSITKFGALEGAQDVNPDLQAAKAQAAQAARDRDDSAGTRQQIAGTGSGAGLMAKSSAPVGTRGGGGGAAAGGGGRATDEQAVKLLIEIRDLMEKIAKSSEVSATTQKEAFNAGLALQTLNG